jgi:hypothetical protein
MLIALIAIFAGASTVFGQVDTLELVEIGEINLPNEISSMSIKDLDFDGNSEICVCTEGYINVYNYLGILCWQSPALSNPHNLQFADFNGDSLLDIAARTESNITILDPHDSTTIWNSENTDITYCYFAAGDCNNDSFGDLAIINKEPFTRIGNLDNVDTVTVIIRYGPLFINTDVYHTTLRNVYVNDELTGLISIQEYPSSAVFVKLRDLDGNPKNKLFVFTNRDSQTSYIHTRIRTTGGIKILSLNPPNSWYSALVDGRLAYLEKMVINDSTMLFAITSSFERIQFLDSYNEYSTKQGNLFRYNDLIQQWTIYSDSADTPNGSDWRTYLVSNIDEVFEGNELVFDTGDSIIARTIPYQTPIWSISDVDGSIWLISGLRCDLLHNVLFLLTSNFPYSEYQLLNGEDGNLEAVFPLNDVIIRSVADINNDNNHEIFSIQSNAIKFYHLSYPLLLDFEPEVPSAFSLSPNYPNPFNSQTMISFSLAAPGDVTLEIFDILGRKMQTLQEGKLEAGSYSITWDSKGAPSGVYFYRLKAGGEEQTKRMLLVK